MRLTSPAPACRPPLPTQAAKLLHFSNISATFSRFESDADRDAATRRISHLPGFWCCKLVEKGQDGGVFYGPFLA